MSVTLRDRFPDSQAPRLSWMAVALALVMTVALFLIIPLSKWFMPVPKADIEIREISMVAPPPPQTPPPPQDSAKPPPGEPDYQPPLPQLSLHDLQVSLEPSAGDALNQSVSMRGFEANIDIVSEMEKIFSFEELEETPHLIYVPSVRYPAELKRLGLTRGTVEMLIVIDTQGHVRVERVLSSTHAAFEPIARRLAEKARFSVTRINGEPVKVRGHWPLTIEQ